MDEWRVDGKANPLNRRWTRPKIAKRHRIAGSWTKHRLSWNANARAFNSHESEFCGKWKLPAILNIASSLRKRCFFSTNA